MSDPRILQQQKSYLRWGSAWWSLDQESNAYPTVPLDLPYLTYLSVLYWMRKTWVRRQWSLFAKIIWVGASRWIVTQYMLQYTQFCYCIGIKQQNISRRLNSLNRVTYIFAYLHSRRANAPSSSTTLNICMYWEPLAYVLVMTEVFTYVFKKICAKY